MVKMAKVDRVSNGYTFAKYKVEEVLRVSSLEREFIRDLDSF